MEKTPPKWVTENDSQVYQSLVDWRSLWWNTSTHRPQQSGTTHVCPRYARSTLMAIGIWFRCFYFSKWLATTRYDGDAESKTWTNVPCYLIQHPPRYSGTRYDAKTAQMIKRLVGVVWRYGEAIDQFPFQSSSSCGCLPPAYRWMGRWTGEPVNVTCRQQVYEISHHHKQKPVESTLEHNNSESTLSSRLIYKDKLVSNRDPHLWINFSEILCSPRILIRGMECYRHLVWLNQTSTHVNCASSSVFHASGESISKCVILIIAYF